MRANFDTIGDYYYHAKNQSRSERAGNDGQLQIGSSTYKIDMASQGVSELGEPGKTEANDDICWGIQQAVFNEPTLTRQRDCAIPNVNIKIEYKLGDTTDFAAKTDQALERIYRGGPTGKKLLDQLSVNAAGTPDLAKRKVIIQPPAYPGQEPVTHPDLTGAQRQRVTPGNDPGKYAMNLAQKGFIKKGEGTSARITWDPHVAVDLELDQDRTAGVPVGLKEDPDRQESHFVLGHELVHGRRILKGTYTGPSGTNTDPHRHDPKTPEGKEELRATGIEQFKNKTPSENSIRREQGAPLRKTYAAQKAGKGKAAVLSNDASGARGKSTKGSA